MSTDHRTAAGRRAPPEPPRRVVPAPGSGAARRGPPSTRAQRDSGRTDTRTLIGSLALFVLVPRLAFLTPGYGHDPDAWAVAHGAWRIWTSGSYIPARPPGFPLHELASALLSPLGPLGTNGATALMSLVAAVSFSLVLRSVSPGNHLLSGLALAYVPGILVNSVVTLDYVWCIAFVLAATYCVLTRRFLLAGALLGCGIGCRITTAGMLLPLGLLTACTVARGERWRGALRLGLGTALVAAPLYALVLGQEPWNWDVAAFLEHHDALRRAKRPFPLAQKLADAPYLLFGTVGCLAIGLGVLAAGTRPWRQSAATVITSRRSALAASSLLAIAVVLATFARFPFEPYYLLPSVPFALLLLACALERRAFAGVCVLLLVSSWIDFGRHGELLSSGPVLAAHDKRVNEYRNGVHILDEIRALPGESVVVTGYWTYQIRTMAHGLQVGEALVIPRIRDERTYRRYARDRPVYFVPRANEMERRLHGLDLSELGAKPLFPEE